MEKGKGMARRWAVDFSDSSLSSHTTVADPPGFARSTPDLVGITPSSLSYHRTICLFVYVLLLLLLSFELLFV
jgi:hypothetical protein